MDVELYAVIMAGGRGTRFWPVSTSRMPKQFLRLAGSGTMLQETAARFRGLCEPDHIIVVTGSDHEGTVLEQLPWIERDNLLLEPEGRNTAPCIGWAARVLAERGKGDAVMAVVPSDHVIDDSEGFRETVRRAVTPALEGRLVTIGIPPDRPATGYGYLHTGRCRKGEVCTVDTFREKPDLETAERYLDSGEYLWNAGMFIWRADTILEQLRLHLPGLSGDLQSLGAGTRPDPAAYGALESVSIDFGVMEKAGDVAAVPALFEWNDIGDWPSSRVCGVGCGEVLSYGSSEVTVWNRDKLTVLLGVSGISIVETDEVTLVMSDEYAQELREVVRDLEEERPELV